MRYVQTLASYLPNLIVQHLIEEDGKIEVPYRQTLETVCMFCDVSGFTALSEAMARNGKGAEGLAKHLNSYFSQMVRIIASEGGDVFKFAGDAMIVLWPRSDESFDVMLRRATQSALKIQSELHQADLEEGVRLSVKIGIGIGRVTILHVGGVFKRMEYIAVGDPLLQAFAAENHAKAGHIIISRRAWDIIKEHFTAEEKFHDDFIRLHLSAKFQSLRKKKPVSLIDKPVVLSL